MRNATIKRTTNETQIALELNLDGSGKTSISTGVGFLDHMLNLWAAHGLFDLSIKATGDYHIDFHHTVEDIGICLGLAFREALGSATGIQRYASRIVPMDESLTQCAIDISNRIFFSMTPPIQKAKIGEFDSELIEEFWTAFCNNARITTHIQILAGQNLHHISESIFKGMGLVLDDASQIDTRRNGIPSTKGVL
jgi:imidazoleglycerol-phosphate dehydratase